MKVWIGKVVATHGIKGEIRISSTFPYKEKAFRVGSKIEIDKRSYKIKSYRRHKDTEMVVLEDFEDINQVLPLVKKEVYKEKEELNLSSTEFVDEELMTYQVKTQEGELASLKEIFWASKTNKILRIDWKGREILLPLASPFVTIDKKQQQILITIISGM